MSLAENKESTLRRKKSGGLLALPVLLFKL
jgi:hypothetical protein